MQFASFELTGRVNDISGTSFLRTLDLIMLEMEIAHKDIENENMWELH